mgnify:CR=1
RGGFELSVRKGRVGNGDPRCSDIGGREGGRSSRHVPVLDPAQADRMTESGTFLVVTLAESILPADRHSLKRCFET